MINDFMNWRKETLTMFESYKNCLIAESLQKGTYKKAIDWLDKQEINLLGHSATTVEDHFNYAIRQMVEDAKTEVRKKAMNSEVK